MDVVASVVLPTTPRTRREARAAAALEPAVLAPTSATTVIPVIETPVPAPLPVAAMLKPASSAASAPAETRRSRRDPIATVSPVTVPMFVHPSLEQTLDDALQTVEETAANTASVPIAPVRAALPAFVQAPASRQDAVGRPPRSARKLGTKIFSIGSMAGVAALLVGLSVPSNAFVSPTDDAQATLEVTPLHGQTLEVAEGAGVGTAPVRDNYTSISYAEVLDLKYSAASLDFAATTGDVRWPFPYTVGTTDHFGDRAGGFHKGVDFTPGDGAPIYVIAEGIVTWVGWDSSGYGYYAMVRHNINGVIVDTMYAHMQDGTSPLTVGTEIPVGEFVGLTGNTGRSYGAHLHFEVHIDGVPVDPYKWLQANALN